MKKLLLGIAGILAMVSSANAVDTAQIKAACQMSDKTLWVERNQVCIPRNPCKAYEDKYYKYCNDIFRDVQTNGNGYMVLIDLYAQTHNLDCVPVEQKAKFIGQDYVICMGNDVMVFEFNDIHDHPLPWEDGSQGEEGTAKWRDELCTAAGGGLPLCDSESICECKGVSEQQCNLIEQVLKKYGLYGREGWAAGWNEFGDTGCIMRDYGWGDYIPDFYSEDGKEHYLF